MNLGLKISYLYEVLQSLRFQHQPHKEPHLLLKLTKLQFLNGATSLHQQCATAQQKLPASDGVALAI